MIISKELEGKVVFLRPTGNNVSRFNRDEVKRATVIKVARVNITLLFEGFRLEEKFKYNSYNNFLDSGYNSGYQIFGSLEELEDVKYCEELSKRISDKYRYSNDYRKISIVDLIRVAEILGVELENIKIKEE